MLAAFAFAFVLLGQAGTTVRGAYDAVVSMAVITYFIPYLYVFAAMMKLQHEPAGPDVIRVPGGKLLRVAISLVGLLATSFTILISVVPQPEDPNKALAILKIVGLTAVLLGVGAWIYWTGKRKILLTTRGV